jgi:hypothetical protein
MSLFEKSDAKTFMNLRLGRDEASAPRAELKSFFASFCDAVSGI